MMVSPVAVVEQVKDQKMHGQMRSGTVPSDLHCLMLRMIIQILFGVLLRELHRCNALPDERVLALEVVHPGVPDGTVTFS